MFMENTKAHHKKKELYLTPEQKERYETMCKLRFDEGKTLQEIGNEFNISRERVRQILNKGKQQKQYRSKVYNGWIWELWVSKKLESLGIKNKLMPYKYSYDIKTENGIRIDVKSTENGNDEYGLGTKSTKKPNYTDFYVVIIIKYMDVFVIPFDLVKGKKSVIISYNDIDKWLEYKDAYDLIKNFTKVGDK